MDDLRGHMDMGGQSEADHDRASEPEVTTVEDHILDDIGQRLLDLAPLEGDRGRIVLASTATGHHQEVILCGLPDNTVTPFVTWRRFHRDMATTEAGHYARTFSEAIQEYQERTAKMSPFGDRSYPGWASSELGLERDDG